MGYRSTEFQPMFTAADEIREKTKIGSYTGSGVQLSEVYSNKEIVKPTVSLFCPGKIICNLSQWRTMRDLRLIVFFLSGSAFLRRLGMVQRLLPVAMDGE